MVLKNEIQALLNAMAQAYRSADAAGCAALFSPNAQLHSAFAPPAVGREAIETLHQEWTNPPGDKSFALLDFGGCNDLAWCLCRFSEGEMTGNGTSLIVLERNAGNGWLIRSCCLFGDDETARKPA